MHACTFKRIRVIAIISTLHKYICTVHVTIIFPANTCTQKWSSDEYRYKTNEYDGNRYRSYYNCIVVKTGTCHNKVFARCLYTKMGVQCIKV